MKRNGHRSRVPSARKRFPDWVYRVPYRARVFSHERGGFATLRDARVLIYFPHGAGDWAQLSHVLAFLEPSNRYWLTRFGDDNVALYDGDRTFRPLYLGVGAVDDKHGGSVGCRHFRLDREYEGLDGSEVELSLPPTAFELCTREGIDAVLFLDFPETQGYSAFPYHTKARNLLRTLAPPERVRADELQRALPSVLDFGAPSPIEPWVEARLRNHAGFGPRRLCLIGRGGFTSLYKSWDAGACRDFMRAMLRADPDWAFVSIESGAADGEAAICSPAWNAFHYGELFGRSPVAPFGSVLKSLVRLADLCVGVPAAPYHVAMARRELPTVGIWRAHVPSWYDEPKAASLHVIGRGVRESGALDAEGSFLEKGELRFRSMHVDSAVITGEDAFAAAEQILPPRARRRRSPFRIDPSDRVLAPAPHRALPPISAHPAGPPSPRPG